MESGRLMEGGRLIGGRLIEVGLYLFLLIKPIQVIWWRNLEDWEEKF